MLTQQANKVNTRHCYQIYRGMDIANALY